MPKGKTWSFFGAPSPLEYSTLSRGRPKGGRGKKNQAFQKGPKHLKIGQIWDAKVQKKRQQNGKKLNLFRRALPTKTFFPFPRPTEGRPRKKKIKHFKRGQKHLKIGQIWDAKVQKNDTKMEKNWTFFGAPSPLKHSSLSRGRPKGGRGKKNQVFQKRPRTTWNWSNLRCQSAKNWQKNEPLKVENFCYKHFSVSG